LKRPIIAIDGGYEMPDQREGHHTDYAGGASTYGMTKAIQDCLPELVRLNQEMEGHARETTAATVEGAVAIGVTQAKFGELLQALSAEWLIAKDAVNTKEEQELARLYGDALVAYHDSATLWAAMETETAETGRIAVGEKLVPLVAQYHLPTHTGIQVEILLPGAVPLVWAVAGERLAKADRSYWAKEG